MSIQTYVEFSVKITFQRLVQIFIVRFVFFLNYLPSAYLHTSSLPATLGPQNTDLVRK